jgi:hypothetical protein
MCACYDVCGDEEEYIEKGNSSQYLVHGERSFRFA